MSFSAQNFGSQVAGVGPVTSKSLSERISARAASFFGGGDIQTFVENFEGASVQGFLLLTAAGGAGASFGVRSVYGGVWRGTTGVTNGGIFYMYSAHIVQSTVASKWYMAARLKLINPIDAVTKLTVLGLADGSSREISLGAYGSSITGGSATKWVCCYDGAAGPAAAQIGISTRSIDTTNWHTFELWSDGTSIFFSVDSETPVKTTAANTAAGRGIYHGCTHSTGGNNYIADIDWFALCFPNAA